MILFVGNALSSKGRAISYTEFLVSKLISDLNLPVMLVSNKRNKLFRLIHVIKTLLIKRSSIKVCLIDTFSTQAFYYAVVTSMVCNILHIKYIPVLHGGNLPQRHFRSSRLVTKYLSGADQIVSPSFYLSNYFSSHGFTIKTIPNSVLLEDYPYKVRKIPELKLLWVRAYDYIYNPMLAVLAVERIHKRGIPVQLTMYGPVKDASFQECNTYVTSNKLNSFINLFTLVPRMEWVQKSSAYTYFLNTTTIDNQPLSLIEAMATGLPVISTRVGGIPFMIQHEINGFLFESNNLASLEELLIYISKLPEAKLQLMSANARFFAAEFDWNIISQKWTKILSEYL